MIAFLEGKVLNATPERLLLLTEAGVGYQVFITKFSYKVIHNKPKCSVWIHTSVREDSITFYGFTNLQEKAVFEALISVDRLGPKLAIKLLSAAPFDVIFGMIKNSDVKGLSKLPGIGSKKAEQIVLKLKGSVIDVEVESSKLKHKDTVVSALVNLGFRQTDVENVVSNFKNDVPVKEAIKKGLSILSGY